MHILDIKPETVFQALSESTRLRIMRLLCVTGEEACLCEFVDALLEPQYKLSRHIKILKQAGLLSTLKDGRWVYHRLVTSSEYLQQLHTSIIMMTDYEGFYQEDIKRFNQRMFIRESGRCRVGVQNTKLLEDNIKNKTDRS